MLYCMSDIYLHKLAYYKELIVYSGRSHLRCMSIFQVSEVMESLPRQAKGNSNTARHLHATSEHENDSSFILEGCGGGLSAQESGKTTQRPCHFQI